MAGNGWMIGFLISFSATIIFCWNGDDDVVYKTFERKPTGHEAIQRIRYVLAKFVAAIFGAGPLIVALVKILVVQYGLRISINQNTAVLMFLASMVVIWAAIGIVQNQIRRFQGRTPRSR